MKPTSDERREVAARLRRGIIARNIQEAYVAVVQSIGVRPCLLTHDGESGDRFDSSAYEAALNRIADLIEPQERTCRIFQAYGDEGEELDHLMEEIACTPEDTVACICQSCGHEFRYERMVRPMFCPNCGARNVTEVD